MPLGFTGDILAEVLKVPPDSINEIISGKRDITVDMALRLARYFNTTPELWTGLQEDYELRMARSANVATMTSRLHALAVQNCGRELSALAVGFPDEKAPRGIEGRPLVVERPLPEDMTDGFQWGKVGGQITSGDAALDHLEDGLKEAPAGGGRASAFGWFGEHGFDEIPSGLRAAGVINGVFHALTEAALKS